MRAVNAGSLLILLATMGADGGPWIVASEEEGLRVEERASADSSLRAFRAEGIVDASPAACLAAVRAEGFFARTVSHVAEARVLASEAAGVRWFYARIDPPFVAARDYTLRVEAAELPSPEGAALQLVWRVDNARGPAPRPGTVRVEHSEGAWTFSPVDGGARTRARYELEADPGGSIPRWIARRVQLAGILAAFDELRRVAPRRQQ